MSSGEKEPRRERVLRRHEVGLLPNAAERVKEAGPAAVREGYLEEGVTKDGRDFG